MIELTGPLTTAVQVTTALALAVSLVLAIVERRVRQDGVAIAAAAAGVAALSLALIGRFLTAEVGLSSPGLVISLALLGMATATIGGNAVTELVLRRADHGPRPAHSGSVQNTTPTAEDLAPEVVDDSPAATAGIDDGDLLRGGTTIGYLERFLTAGALLAGALTAVAIIVAVKGLGRFTELDSPPARERFIIGTLASLGWAAVSICPALLLS